MLSRTIFQGKKKDAVYNNRNRKNPDLNLQIKFQGARKQFWEST